MNKIYALILTLLCLIAPFFLLGVTHNWTGNGAGNSWSNPFNWDPANVPGAGDVAIIGAGDVVDVDQVVAVATLSITGGTIDTQGFAISATSTISILGGTINNTGLTTTIFSAPDLAELSITNFNGNFIFTKTGGTNNTLSGGNTFIGDTEFILTATAGGRLRLAANAGDSFNGDLNLRNASGSRLEPSYKSGTTTTVTGNIGLENTGTGGMHFGANGGATQLSGFFDVLSSYSLGPLLFNKVNQLGGANDLFTPTVFEAVASTFFGSVLATSLVEVSRLDNCQFRATAFFSASDLTQIRNCKFSQDSGIAFLEKTGGGTNTHGGGNTFYRFALIVNRGPLLTMGISKADVFLAESSFENNSFTGRLRVAHTGTGHEFHNDILVRNLNPAPTNRITFGDGGGTSTFFNGTLTSSGFVGGRLEINHMTQTGTGLIDLEVPWLKVTDSAFKGDFNVTAPNVIELETSSFAGDNVFISPNLREVSGCTFNPMSGSTSFQKQIGGSGNGWAGGNVFGELSVINDSALDLILADDPGNPDTFNGPAAFNRNGTGNFIVAENGDNSFKSDITVGGLVTFGPGKTVIDGNTTQKFTGPNATVNHLQMQTTGSLLLNSVLVMNSGDQLTFSQGNILSSSANRLTFKDGASHSGASDASFAEGPVAKDGIQDFTFPTGGTGFYAPIGISMLANSDVFTAQYFKDDPQTAVGSTLDPSDPDLDHISGTEYWTVNSLSGATDAKLTLSWDSRSGGVTELLQLIISYFDGSIWKRIDGTASGSNASGTITANVVVSGSVFGIFTLGSKTPANPLPVELLFFQARSEEALVRLNWATATELNNDFFTVERSPNGVDFVPIATVPGQGNSNTTHSYTALDRSPLTGVSYYRLKQTDYDGQFSYSDVASVRRDQGDQPVIFPNPAGDTFQVSWPGGGNLQLSTLAGQELWRRSVPDGVQPTGIPIDDLSPGVYLIRFFDAEGRIAGLEKLVVQ